MRVFTYGMLMSWADEPAELPGYRLEFYDGLATIEECPDSRVLGGVKAVDDMHLRHYDRVEGVNHDVPENGHYRRERVVTATGESVWVYIRNPFGQLRPPPEGYLCSVREGYEKFSWPKDELQAAVVRADQALKARIAAFQN